MIFLYNLLLVFLYYLIITFFCRNKSERNKYFAIVVCLHATIFRLLANPYNYVDTEFYASAYEQISTWTLGETIFSFNQYTDWGIGYLFINWLLGQISSNPMLLFCSLSILTIPPVIWFYYKTSNSILLSVIIYLMYPMMYYMGFGVLRQHLAVSIILISLYNIDKYKISIPLILFAISVHTSAIVCIPFYFWKYKINFQRISPVKIFIYIITAVITARFIMNDILSSFSRYAELLEQKETNNIVPVLFIGSLVVLFIINNSLKYIKVKYDVNIINYCIYGFAVAFFGVGLSGMGRLSLYFIYVMPVALSFLFKYNRNKLLSFLYLFFIFIFVFTMIYFNIDNENYNYSFFWQPSITLFL